MDNIQRLDIPGARKSVEIEGVLGITYKIRLGGTVIRRTKGAWAIPMRSGVDGKLTSRGLIPGFQTILLDGAPIYKIGAHVPLLHRILMFTSLLLVLFAFPWGSVLAVLLFFISVPVVKNIHMPAVLRAVLPVVNTAAVGLILIILSSPR